MAVIPIVVGALGTIHKVLEKGLKDLEIRGQVETIQTTALRSVTIPRKVMETCGLAVTQTPVKNHLLKLV